MTRPEPFGTAPDGSVIWAVTLRCGVVSARVISFGAALQSLIVPDRDGILDDVVLGHDGPEGYMQNRKCFGSTVGRVANRIADGGFQIDGTFHQVAVNEGTSTLHGGTDGFDQRNWQVGVVTDTSVQLSLLSPDGDMGFPGSLTATVTYRLVPRGDAVALEIIHRAETDAPTPVNLTNHSYFALCGHSALAARPASGLEYALTVNAGRYLPVDKRKIPTAPAPVGATPFDFRRPRQPVTAVRSGALEGYDHCLCLEDGQAVLVDEVSGRRMRLETNQTGLQVYTAQALTPDVIGKGGHAYQPFDAICLEAQAWPNAVNMPPETGRPDTILRPGQTYDCRIAFVFDTV
ncbi:aldose epimerase family protein [Donghicola tyrosinivorans]|uniref:Aldose 1-epimerase n=1 Tax=Donghicola tyrosinivorans TaxID=1652492 RepID=A0A2T0WEX0_9RHOB|nr:aldose epimerase family protein [Donghicola tyrosinivorans]PRY85222.1 aldose 1-epimerase [Donghicola tyrosinivorans]